MRLIPCLGFVLFLFLHLGTVKSTIHCADQHQLLHPGVYLPIWGKKDFICATYCGNVTIDAAVLYNSEFDGEDLTIYPTSFSGCCYSYKQPAVILNNNKRCVTVTGKCSKKSCGGYQIGFLGVSKCDTAVIYGCTGCAKDSLSTDNFYYDWSLTSDGYSIGAVKKDLGCHSFTNETFPQLPGI